MSIIVINYNKLDDAADYAEKGIKRCKKYIDDLEDVQKKLTSSDVRNVEDNGSVNTALNLARRKMEEAQSFKSTFTECAKAINNAKVTVKEKDRVAASNINTIMNAYLGRRGILSKAKEFMYRQYTCFLDKIGGMGELGKRIKVIIKNAEIALNAWWEEDVKNWFKYGNGRYVKNIVDGLVGVVLSAATLIGVIATLPVSGPLMVAGLVVAVASGIALAYTMVDASIQIDQNSKAYSLGRQGNTTAARYYGDIDGFREWTKRRDFGGKVANTLVEIQGVLHDVGKTVANTVSAFGSMYLGVAKLGVTTNAQGAQIVDWNRAWTGYKYKILHKAGLNSNDYQTGGFSLKTAFSPESYAKKIFSNKTTKAVSKLGVIEKAFGYTADTLKTWKNIEGVKKGVETLASPDAGVYDKIGAFMKTAGKLPIVDSFGSDVWSTVDGVKKLFTPVVTALT